MKVKNHSSLRSISFVNISSNVRRRIIKIEIAERIQTITAPDVSRHRYLNPIQNYARAADESLLEIYFAVLCLNVITNSTECHEAQSTRNDTPYPIRQPRIPCVSRKVGNFGSMYACARASAVHTHTHIDNVAGILPMKEYNSALEVTIETCMLRCAIDAQDRFLHPSL